MGLAAAPLFPGLPPAWRALTLWQPWASLVRPGYKEVETRSWGTDYRGPLMIHASAKNGQVIRAARRSMAPWLDRFGLDPGPIREPGIFSAVVAVAELADCLRVPEGRHDYRLQDGAFGDLSPGRYAWRLARIVALDEPIPARGHQGLWRPTTALVEAVEAATAAAGRGAAR